MADRAAAYARAKLDGAVDPAAATFNRALRQRIMLPLASRDVWPQTHGIHSESSGLMLALLQRTPGHFGESTPPPAVTTPASPQILVHAYFLEQLVAELVCSKTLFGKELHKWLSTSDLPLRRLNRKASGRSFPGPRGDFRILPGRFRHIKLRLSGFHAAGPGLSPMEVAVQYRLHQLGDRLGLHAWARSISTLSALCEANNGSAVPSWPHVMCCAAGSRQTCRADFDLWAMWDPRQEMRLKLSGFSITQDWLCLTIVPLEQSNQDRK